MARSCGIRIGPRRYEIVVLDGSPKKHQISAYYAGEFPTDVEDEEGEFSAALRKAAKDHNIPRENIGLVVDSGHAAFRRLQLPFSDTTKVEQVLKYEVEGLLPQWNIDDVVVDFQKLSEEEDACELLISAVPKTELGSLLSICERAGIEPLDAELETTALVNAASGAEIFSEDSAQLLVHVGDYSTSVVVVEGGQIREMRVIHIGALNPVPKDKESEEEEASAEDGGSDKSDELVDPGELLTLENPEEPDAVQESRRIDQALKRIRRELGRTISGGRTSRPIEAIYVCGIELPGLIGSVVHDVPIYLLDCFDEDGGQPADGYGALVVAYGAAIHQLGGGAVVSSLRREELRYTGAFERIEFPLAVASLLVTTLLGVICILQLNQTRWQERGVQFWLRSSNNYMVGDKVKGEIGTLNPTPDDIEEYAQLLGTEGDPNRTPIESLQYIHDELATRVLSLQSALGQDSDVKKPQSAFVATMLVLDVLDSIEGARPSLRKVRSSYQKARRGNEESVAISIDLTFFADNSLRGTEHYESFQQKLEAKPWLVELERKKSTPLEGDAGISIDGLPITVDVEKYYESLNSLAKEGV